MRYIHRIFNRVTLTAALILLQIVWIALSLYSLSDHYAYIETAFLVLSIFVCVYIINRPGNPAVKLAWIVLVTVFPIGGWMIYFLTGGRGPTAGMRRRARRGQAATAGCKREGGDALARLRAGDRRAGGLSQYLERRGYPLCDAADASYYASGEEAFPAMLEAIRGAKCFVLLEYFIIAEGEMWESILEALGERAAAGVEVRVMYDGVGSIGTLPRRYRRRLETLGIRALAFNPVRPIFSAVLNYRDHRKILVVDGEVAFTGGINIADEYINRVERFGYWKDSAVRITGDGVGTMTALFLEMWNSIRVTDTDVSPYLCRARTKGESAGGGAFVQPYGDSPLDGEAVGENVYLDIISRAERYVWFCTPYLVIDHALSTALVYAARRGVEVRIVTPGIPDKRAVYTVTRSSYHELIEGGIEIYEYTPGFIHGKCCLSDDAVATVGSVNLDYRSFGLHFENGCVFYGTPVVGELKSDFERIFADSKRILRPYRRGGLVGELCSAVLRLMAPLL